MLVNFKQIMILISIKSEPFFVVIFFSKLLFSYFIWTFFSNLSNFVAFLFKLVFWYLTYSNLILSICFRFLFTFKLLFNLFFSSFNLDLIHSTLSCNKLWNEVDLNMVLMLRWKSLIIWNIFGEFVQFGRTESWPSSLLNRKGGSEEFL